MALKKNYRDIFAWVVKRFFFSNQAGAPKCKHLNRGKNMKKVLLTTTAIVGLSAPAFAADPTAVSDQPYFHHSHPMTWSGAMSITVDKTSHQKTLILQ